MPRATCIKRILDIAKARNVKPALVMPNNGCKPNAATKALLIKCTVKPEHTAREIKNPIENQKVSGEFIDELRLAVDFLLDVGTSEARNDNTWLRAVECRKARYTEDEAFEMIAEWNELNVPPLSYSEVKMAVNSAYVGKAYDTGTKKYPMLGKARKHAKTVMQKKRVKPRRLVDEEEEDDFEENTDEAEPEKEKRTRKKKKVYKEEEVNPKWRLPISIYDIVHDKSIKEIPDRVGRWISFRKKTTLLGAREKAGKSTFAWYDAYYAMQQGHKVMWVGGWGDSDKDELKAMHAEAKMGKLGRDANKNLLHISTNEELPQSWEELFYQIRHVKPDLLVLDTLTSVLNTCHPTGAPDTSEPEKWNEIVSIIKPLAVELNMAVVWIHHTTKANMEEFRGSTAIAASVDYLVLMVYKNKFAFERKVLSQGRITMAIPREMHIRYVAGEEGFVEVEASEQGSIDTATNAVKVALQQILISGKKVEKNIVFKLLKEEYDIECGSSTIRRARMDLGVEVDREGNMYYWYIPVEVQTKSLGKVNEEDESF